MRLGEALISLKGSLMGSQKESESRRRDEENRTWTAQGLAIFSSLFREVEDNLEDLSRALIKELVDYTEADAGAFLLPGRRRLGRANCWKLAAVMLSTGRNTCIVHFDLGRASPEGLQWKGSTYISAIFLRST